MPLKDPHRQVVGDHQPLGSIFLDLAAELAGARYLAEDIAHRDVHQGGKLAEHGPLRPLAATWHPEKKNASVFSGFLARSNSSTHEGTDQNAPGSGPVVSGQPPCQTAPWLRSSTPAACSTTNRRR